MVFSFVLLLFLFGLLCLPGYILAGIGLYAIAHRRGIHQPWMAWVPGLKFYLIGCISDQYQAMVPGKNKNKRTVLLLLFLIQLTAFCAMHIFAPDGRENISMVTFFLIFLPAWGGCAAMTVIGLMALYDIYVSCDPKRAVLFLILSIVLPVTQPFFLFACRKKDLGFPL